MADHPYIPRTVSVSTRCDRCHRIAPPLKHVRVTDPDEASVVMDEIVCIPCLERCDDTLSAAYPTAVRRWRLTSVDGDLIAPRLRLRAGIIEVSIHRPPTK